MERKIPKEEYPSLIKRLEGGEQYQSIANSYGVSKERIRQIAKSSGLVGGGHEIRRRNKYLEILRNINEKSKELFYHSGCDTYDLIEECLELYKVKKYYFSKTTLPFDVSFTDIIWNRFCPLSGEELDYFTERTSQYAPIITFIDWNKGGYVNGNVHTISRFMKSSVSRDIIYV